MCFVQFAFGACTTANFQSRQQFSQHRASKKKLASLPRFSCLCSSFFKFILRGQTFQHMGRDCARHSEGLGSLRTNTPRTLLFTFHYLKPQVTDLQDVIEIFNFTTFQIFIATILVQTIFSIYDFQLVKRKIYSTGLS